jgi:phosphatidyl-myo-inositol dimannoside synthase
VRKVCRLLGLSGFLSKSLGVLFPAACGDVKNIFLVDTPVRLRRGSSFKAPLALIIHGIEAWQPTRHGLTNQLARRVDALIAVSTFTMQRFLGWARGDIARRFILPDCIDLERYGAGAKNLELLHRYGLTGKTVIMTLGRLSEHEKYKGVDEILELMPALLKDIPNIAYLIVGDGTDRKRLEEKARSSGIHGRVVFAGYIPESEKADHYRLADAYVMPGRGEG